MEKEIELIRMSSTEIMEKVAAYKDEQIIILNQVNKVNETEQYSSIRADFFLAILCLRGKASLSLNNNSYEIGRNDLMICHPQTLLKHGMIGDDFECCGFCLSPEYPRKNTERNYLNKKEMCNSFLHIYKKMSAHLTKMTGGHFYFSTIRKLLMLFTQQIVHSLYRIEST